MRRIDIVIGLLVLAIVSGVLFGVKFFADPDRKLIRNEDAEVIDAALLSFYKKASWQDPGWQKGDFIVVDPECKSLAGDEIDFSKQISELSSYAKKEDIEPRSLPALEKLARRYAGTKNSKPAPTLNLKSLRLDKRIVIGEPTWDNWSFSSPPTEIFNQHGEGGTQRVGLQIGTPLYSKDRRAALIRVQGISGTAHGGGITFILDRVGNRWKVVFTHVWFYV